MSENEKYISQSDEMGNIHISTEVLAVLAGAAALETEGVGGMAAGLSSDMAELVGRKVVAKGVRLTIAEDHLSIDLSILVKYGYAVPDVAKAVQENVMNAVVNTSGLNVDSVNVMVAGVVFPKATNR